MVVRAELRDELLPLLLNQQVEPDSWDALHRYRMLSFYLSSEPNVVSLLQADSRNGNLYAIDVLNENGYLEWFVENILPTFPKDEWWQLSLWRDDNPMDPSPLADQLDVAIHEFEAVVAKRPQRKLKPLTYEELLVRIQKGTNRLRGFREIAKSLSRKQIEEVAELWLAERHWRRARNYAELFEYVPFPFSVRRIVDLIRAGDPPVWFNDVISKSKDPLARELGLELITQENPDYRGFECMASTWGPSDVDVMLGSLKRFVDIEEDDLHSVVIDLLSDAYELLPNSEVVMCWIYEHSPCSYCRGRAAERMFKVGLLPDEYREELPFDGDDDAREMVANR